MKYRLLSHPEKIRKTDEIFHPYECNWFPVPDEYVGGIVKPGVEGLPVRRKLEVGTNLFDLYGSFSKFWKLQNNNVETPAFECFIAGIRYANEGVFWGEIRPGEEEILLGGIRVKQENLFEGLTK
jgi:hypothetical protein